jgi:hypothetical protein
MTVEMDDIRSSNTEAQAKVYHSYEPGPGIDDTYYFCCKTCGNCGRRWTSHARAIDEAITHVLEPHHHYTKESR